MPAKVMGILNITPDSHFDGGKHNTFESAVKKGIQMYEEGADIIDIGGESTRPGALAVSEENELARVIPVIKELKSCIPIPISIDTMKPRVARAAVKAGATFLNDITGFEDPEMIKLAVETGLEICVMHMQGRPATMQLNPHYENGIVNDLLEWFENRTDKLIKAGIKKEQIILDPGIGFGKTVDDNLKILHNLQKFKAMDFPLLVGLSRKSFISKTVNKPAAELLPATIAMNTVAILAEADIIRVYDVTAHRDVVIMLEKYKMAK